VTRLHDNQVRNTVYEQASYLRHFTARFEPLQSLA